MIREIALDHGDDPALRRQLRPYQIRILERIATCGTPAAGMHREACDACGDVRMRPNTCGSRSCPHCQGRARAEWVDERMEELLPCGYFHVVLTLPPILRDLAMAFPRVVLGALMSAAGDAIDHLCHKPAFLGATVGQLAILHTWRRDLGIHPHVHVLVTAGGWNDEQGTWVEAQRHGAADRPFLLPVDVLLAAFQRRLRRLLLRAQAHGDFLNGPHEAHPALATTATFTGLLNRMCATRGVARIEPPFGGPTQLLKYLGAYVNRVALSPRRVTAYDAATGLVTYAWSTNAAPDVACTATIPATDFLIRFAQHILPPGFQRIRFRGLWCTAHRATKLHIVQAWFAANRTTISSPPTPPATSTSTPPARPLAEDPCRCTTCGLGRYQFVPGTWQRPTAAGRRQQLDQIRRQRRIPTPVEALIPA
jgi:hypothetical protein